MHGSSDDADDSLLAALSSSRSSSRRKSATVSGAPSPRKSSSPIVIGSPSPIASPTPPSQAISMEDLFGGASSDSDGTLSVKSDTCQPCNKLLTPVAYAALPDTTVPRDQWIPGYRDRVPRSTPAVAPWSARRVSLICVADLDLDAYTATSRNRRVVFSPHERPKFQILLSHSGLHP